MDRPAPPALSPESAGRCVRLLLPTPEDSPAPLEPPTLTHQVGSVLSHPVSSPSFLGSHFSEPVGRHHSAPHHRPQGSSRILTSRHCRLVPRSPTPPCPHASNEAHPFPAYKPPTSLGLQADPALPVSIGLPRTHPASSIFYSQSVTRGSDLTHGRADRHEEPHPKGTGEEHQGLCPRLDLVCLQPLVG